MSFVYQIFPDRFAIGGGLTVAEKLSRVDMTGLERAPSWDARPRPTGKEIFGGDLDGVAEKLDHVKALGASVVYLTPIFDAPSSHRYDARSYRRTDDRLGGDAAFDRLVAATRAARLGLVLDAVFNHTGEEHAWYRGERRDWYSGVPWRGFGHLPELRLEDEDLRRELFTGEESVLRSWLRRGATGWRIDCANDCGIEVCSIMRQVAAQEGAKDGVTGEVMSWAAPYLRAGALDGCMNYWFRESVVSLLRGEIPPEQASALLADMAREYPREALLRSWNVVGSHDTPRVRTLLGERALAAFLLSFTMPGIPFVYYGDEIGLEGGDDPDCRRPMPWDRARWDERPLERIRALGALRRERRALREGFYVPLVAPGALAFARTTDDPRETTIVVLNAGEARRELKVFVPRTEIFDAIPLDDLLGGPGAQAKSGAFKISLDAGQGAVLAPRHREASGYDFMKRVEGL